MIPGSLNTMMLGEVAAAGGGLLLDLLTATPVMALSLRKLRAAYGGSAIRVERSSDNTTQDIGFSGDVLDTSALTAFVGAGDGRVTRWYNQHSSGGFWSATYNEAPFIVQSGTVITDSGETSLRFDVGSFIYIVDPISWTQYSVNAVIKRATSTGNLFLFSHGTINFQLFRFDGTAASTYLNGPQADCPSAVDAHTSQTVLTLTRNASGNVDLYRNSASAIRFTGTVNVSSELNRCFKLFSVSSGQTFCAEMLAFASTLSEGDLSTLSSNQMTYYGI